MELTLFVIVGAIAVISAAMMLISENAIYSALFLILNFACIAFFFLMLNAPFLAMVQITVYAGAIMVLFLFVIMLLGAERVTSATVTVDLWQSRLTIPVAIVFALVFLVIASAAIIDSDIDHIEAEKIDPHIRVVHAFSEAPNVDVYLDDELIAANVSYKGSTDFEVWDQTGLQTVKMVEAGTEKSGKALAEKTVEINEGEAISFVVIASDSSDAKAGLAVATEKVAFNDEQGTSRVIAINALPNWSFVDVVNTSDGDAMLVDNLAYGIPSAGFLLDKGEHSIGVFPDGNDNMALASLKNHEFDDNTSLLWVITDERQAGNAFENVLLNFEVDGSPSFGSPTHVGRLLFTRYVLPFEMVSLLLLVAMIGAIVLTHEALAVRRQPMRQLANPPAGLEQPIIGEPNK